MYNTQTYQDGRWDGQTDGQSQFWKGLVFYDTGSRTDTQTNKIKPINSLDSYSIGQRLHQVLREMQVSQVRQA